MVGIPSLPCLFTASSLLTLQAPPIPPEWLRFVEFPLWSGLDERTASSFYQAGKPSGFKGVIKDSESQNVSSLELRQTSKQLTPVLNLAAL